MNGAYEIFKQSLALQQEVQSSDLFIVTIKTTCFSETQNGYQNNPNGLATEHTANKIKKAS